ncbi:hypothetical protein H0E86_21690 [Streptomyces sp. SCSIO-PteL053]|nr:hypothetical protein H0E86_21690 [Streptomyces sp. SCSIO-PteL053]
MAAPPADMYARSTTVAPDGSNTLAWTYPVKVSLATARERSSPSSATNDVCTSCPRRAISTRVGAATVVNCGAEAGWDSVSLSVPVPAEPGSAVIVYVPDAGNGALSHSVVPLAETLNPSSRDPSGAATSIEL